MVASKETKCLLHVTGCLKSSQTIKSTDSKGSTIKQIYDSLIDKCSEDNSNMAFFVRSKEGDRFTISQCSKGNSGFDSETLASLSHQLVLGHPVFEIDVAVLFASKVPESGDEVIQAPVLTESLNPDQTKFHSFDIPIDILQLVCSSKLNEQTLRQFLEHHLHLQKTFHNQLEDSSNESKSWDQNSSIVPSYPYHFDLTSFRNEELSESSDNSRNLNEEPNIVTELMPIGGKEDLGRSVRSKLHEKYGIEKSKPVFRKENAVRFKPLFTTQLVFDESTTPPPPKLSGLSGIGNYAGTVCETVKGQYAYFHYMQDSMSDSGWGCAYRSLQTVWSWFLLQGYTHKKVIGHKEIQQTLHTIGDKPASFVGSSQWIGSFEVSYVLDHHLDITSAFINVQSGDQLVSNASRIAQHFKTHGTPIMVGGGVLAHTICGIYYEDEAIEHSVRYLILDPHYTGTDDMKNIKKKAVYAWKPQSFWKSDSFYNLCLPQRPNVF